MFLLVVLTIAVAATNLDTPAPRGASDLVIDAAAQEELVDLAWLAPGPTDLEEDGYGLSYGTYNPVVEGEVSVFGSPDPLTAYDEAFSSAGARQTYFQAMSIPEEDDPDVAARTVSVVIGEFADSDAAKSGFEGVVVVLGESYDQTRTPPEVGDEALAFRGEFSDPVDGRIFQELRFVFRTGRFLADLTIDDYLDDAPATSELTPLAELLGQRLKDAEAVESPGLALQVVRIASPDLTGYYDYYTRRGGDEVRSQGVLTSGMRSNDEHFEEVGVTDLYYYWSETQFTEDSENSVGLGV